MSKSPQRDSSRATYRNNILASLPKAELDALFPHLSPVTLERGQTVITPGQKVEYVHFLESGLASVVVNTETGTSVEVGVIGREGVIGLPVLLGTDSIPTRTFIQIAATGFRIRGGILLREFETQSTLRQRLQCCLQAQLMQASQTAVCNRLHDIAERLARWLLMCQDRTESHELEITHQCLGDMLGAPRSTVTLAARMLQRAGLMDYSRGHIRILNRAGLEDAACECYGNIRNECARLQVL